MRKTRSSSGAVTVQVMRKVNGRDVVVAHVGSAHTDADLGILLQRAGEIAADGQQVLDFEVPVPVARMADVADWRAGELVLPALAGVASPVAVSGAARTVGSSSRLLYEVIGAVYDALGFDGVGDEVFRDLVIARIIEPTSKGRLDTGSGRTGRSHGVVPDHSTPARSCRASGIPRPDCREML